MGSLHKEILKKAYSSVDSTQPQPRHSKKSKAAIKFYDKFFIATKRFKTR